MSFTIKCDKCGHTSKFTPGRERQKRPISVYEKTEPGDAPGWMVMECSVCGHKVEEI